MKRHRTESRQSQLLQITHWLNQSNNNECFMFLEELKKEFNHNTIGSLIATLLLNNKTFLSNTNINSLQQYCLSNKHSTKNTSPPPQPQPQSREAKNSCFPLLSLPNDVFDFLAPYLTKQDAINLGLTGHKLYHITQREPMLYGSGCHGILITSRKMQQIADTGIDPWGLWYNCRHITLAGGKQLIHDSIMSEMLNKIRNESYYTGWYEMIFKHVNTITIFENGAGLLGNLPMDTIFGVSKRNIHTNKMDIISREPLSLRFDARGLYAYAVEEFMNKYTDYLDDVRQRVRANTNALRNCNDHDISPSRFQSKSGFKLQFTGTQQHAPQSESPAAVLIEPELKLESGTRSQREREVERERERETGLKSVEVRQIHSLVLESFGSVEIQNISSQIGRLGSNYTRLHASCEILFNSLRIFNNLCHERLESLNVEAISFSTYIIMHDVYMAAYMNRYEFNLQDIISDNVDKHKNYSQTVLDVLTNEQKLLLKQRETFDILQRIEVSLQVGGPNLLHFQDMSFWAARLITDGTSSSRHNTNINNVNAIANAGANSPDYSGMFDTDLERGMDASDSNININNNININDGDSNHFQVNMEELDHGVIADNRHTALVYALYFMVLQEWLIELIDSGKLYQSIQSTNMKYIRLSQNYGKLYFRQHPRELMLVKFNQLFTNKVCYRLLNWKNSVEFLNLEFLAGIIRSGTDNYGTDDNINNINNVDDVRFGNNRDSGVACMNAFKIALNNIFSEDNFEKLRKVAIQIQLGTKYDNIALVDDNKNNTINHNNDELSPTSPYRSPTSPCYTPTPIVSTKNDADDDLNLDVKSIPTLENNDNNDNNDHDNNSDNNNNDDSNNISSSNLDEDSKTRNGNETHGNITNVRFSDTVSIASSNDNNDTNNNNNNNIINNNNNNNINNNNDNHNGGDFGGNHFDGQLPFRRHEFDETVNRCIDTYVDVVGDIIKSHSNGIKTDRDKLIISICFVVGNMQDHKFGDSFTMEQELTSRGLLEKNIISDADKLCMGQQEKSQKINKDSSKFEEKEQKMEEKESINVETDGETTMLTPMTQFAQEMTRMRQAVTLCIARCDIKNDCFVSRQYTTECFTD